ncbi:sunset domain-containing protein [Microlunatus antarcticus]|uniref:Uncharacterized protein n=1 Tax=Microlunatus antarcticus TaxID=53388 RepID=A0A7W5P894_9ACTN|nr:hypothetical protein [Microlunatus antarcticus]MBB3328343.1 hypothetical protein [Microlunatus antarcticus]
MNKTPDPGEVVRDKVVPVAQAAAEKTVALAHSAAEKVAPLTHQAVEAVTPFAQQVSDAVSPYAHQAADAVGPYAAQVNDLGHQAADRVAPYAHQAAEAVAPYAALVRQQGVKSGHDLADRLEPALEAAREAFSGARDKVTSEYVPAVGAAAATAAASATPLVTSAADRGRSLVQSVRKEPAVVLPPPRKKHRWLTTLAVVGAAAAATYVVVRKLVGDKGSQWQTARPTTPYAPPVAAEPRVSAEAGVAEPQPETAGPGETDVVASTTSLYGTAGTPGDESGTVEDVDGSAIAARHANLDDVASVDEGDDAPSVPSATDAGSTGAGTTGSSDSTGDDSTGADNVGAGAETPYGDEKIETELETVEERAYEEPADAVWAEQDTKTGGGPEAHPERYDMAGAYVGVEPPEGFAIKGNERSMKYHLPDSNGWARTIAEVWFSSEEAAQQAGFTKAQH